MARYETPDRRLVSMGGGWGGSVLQTVDDALRRLAMITGSPAIIADRLCGGALIVFPASVLRMGCRIVSGSSWPRRCIGCEAEERGPSLPSRLAGRLMPSGRFAL
jgi:hypothetical protein